MKLFRTIVILATVALVAAVVGCGSDGAGSADLASEHYAAGLLDLNEELAGVDFDEAPWDWDADVEAALAEFEEALEHDPDHCGALLGAAVSRVLGVLTDPQLREVLNDLFPRERGGSARALLWYSRTPDVIGLAERVGRDRGDFDFSELQDYVETVALPEFEAADDRLVRFEELGYEVELLIVLADSLDRRDQMAYVDLDVTDAYFAHAALDALQAVCHLLAAYNIDVDDAQTPQELVELDADFLTLRSGGHMPSAYDELLSVGAHLLAAADALESEVDAQANDLIGESEGLVKLDELLGDSPLEEVRDVGGAIGAALTGGIVVNPGEFAPGAPDLQILIDLDELLNDPLLDLRDYLPEHTWPSPNSVVVTFPVTMPDPTLDGITPEMTDPDWGEIVAWLQSLAD